MVAIKSTWWIFRSSSLDLWLPEEMSSQLIGLSSYSAFLAGPLHYFGQIFCTNLIQFFSVQNMGHDQLKKCSKYHLVSLLDEKQRSTFAIFGPFFIQVSLLTNSAMRCASTWRLGIIIIIIIITTISYFKVGEATAASGLWSASSCSTDTILGICEYDPFITIHSI